MPPKSAPILNIFASSKHGTGGPQDPTRIAFSNHGGQTLSGDHSKPCAHQLHGRHERKREECGPESGVAEGGPRNRIGGNAGRIVVGGASDHSWAEILEELLEGGWCRNLSGLICDCHAAEVPAKERCLRISSCDRPFGRHAAHLEVPDGWEVATWLNGNCKFGKPRPGQDFTGSRSWDREWIVGILSPTFLRKLNSTPNPEFEKVTDGCASSRTQLLS